VTIDGLVGRFAQRITDGFLYGDFQFAIDSRSPDFLRRGVFALNNAPTAPSHAALGLPAPHRTDVRSAPQDRLSAGLLMLGGAPPAAAALCARRSGG
jgi:hypothetical protein